MAVVVFVILIAVVVFHRGGLQNWVVFFPRDGDGGGGLSNPILVITVIVESFL